MTNQEAVKIINVNGYGYSEKDAVEAHRIVEREMEFRTGKPVKQKEGGTTSLFGEALCPVCGNLVFGTEKYCSECGQALKWEVMNDET